LSIFIRSRKAVVAESNSGPQNFPHHAETYSLPGTQSNQAPGRTAQQIGATSGRPRRTSAAQTATHAATSPRSDAGASAAAGVARDDAGISRCASAALPHISIGRLEQQMDQVARAATASPPLPKFKNPKGPVADFYIAGWIQKLERIGDLNYPGDMVGQLKVKVVLNPQGDLKRIIMVRSSGNKALDAAAERIIRLSFPYMPFSKQLAEQTRKIEIPLNMHFLGVRHVSAGGVNPIR
jgi:TonB family C-terminal domain